MRKIRTREGSRMNTGSSACSTNWEKVKGAILTEHGVKLPADITGEKLLELCYVNRPRRIYLILPFLEYARNGGEPQVNAVGYGASEYNELSTWTGTFTLKKLDEVLDAQFLKCADKGWNVYFWNQDNMLIGYNDDTGIFVGIPMSTVYPAVTQYPTSSIKSVAIVSFSHRDAEDSQLHSSCVQLNFNPKNFVKGLVDVVFQELEVENTYKIVEVAGGYDRTEEFGNLIADSAAEIMNSVASATYSDSVITVVPKAGAVPSLKAPSVLYGKGIRDIRQVS